MMMRRIDLLPQVRAEERRARRSIALVIVAGLLALTLLVLWWLTLGTQITTAENDLEAAERRNQQLAAQIAELQNLADLQSEVLMKEQALELVMAGDIAWSSVLTEIAMVTPPEVWITSFQASAGATEGSTPAGTETAAVRVNSGPSTGRIQFQGNSTTMLGVSKWLLRLADVRGFQAIWLNNAQEGDQNGQAVVTFDNTVELGRRALSLRFAGEDS